MGVSARTAETDRVPVAALIVALVALVIPTLGVFASIEFAAWQANHGHIGSAAAVAHHTHDGSDAASDIVFTPSDDGSVASALTLTRALVELTFLAGGTAHANMPDEAIAPAGIQPRVPVPPPRA